MDYFEYKQYEFVKVDPDGRKVLAVSISPEKSCIFNCAICNLGKTKYQGEWHDFGPVEESLEGLRPWKTPSITIPFSMRIFLPQQLQRISCT